LKISNKASSLELFLSATREFIIPKLPVAWLAFMMENSFMES